MLKIRLGGVKTFENRACLYSSCISEADALGNICSVLAADRINMGMLTYIADNGFGDSITVACAKNAARFSGYMLEMAGSKGCRTAEVVSDVGRISLFPHDRRPEIMASVIAVLRAGFIKPYGIASSPSAVTIVVSSSDFEATMERLFDCFAFSACASYRDWLSACRMDEQQISDVRCTYDEQIISVYGFTRQNGYDLWNVSLPIEHMGNFGTFLTDLDRFGLKLPFLISSPVCREDCIHFSFALAEEGREAIRWTFDKNLPGNEYFCRGPVSVILLHGPHFGDRHGIADAFVTTLRSGRISLLALSCAVSSISAVIDGDKPDRAVEVLNGRFQVPLDKWTLP
jgi:aspartokinase